jgi:hypothetical protein
MNEGRILDQKGFTLESSPKYKTWLTFIYNWPELAKEIEFKHKQL